MERNLKMKIKKGDLIKQKMEYDKMMKISKEYCENGKYWERRVKNAMTMYQIGDEQEKKKWFELWKEAMIDVLKKNEKYVDWKNLF
jgi:hypothetical protein